MLELFITTFEAVFLLIGLGLAGVWVIAGKISPQQTLKALSPIVLDIALPCMIFFDIVTRFTPSEITRWYLLPLYQISAMFLPLIIIIPISYIFSSENRQELRLCLFYPNAVFFPIAVISGLYGENSSLLPQLFVFTLLFSVILFNGASFFFEKKQKNLSFSQTVIKSINPVIVMTVLAIIIVLTSTTSMIPEVILNIINRIGMITLPLIMIITGGNIAADFKNSGKFHFKPVIGFVLLKNLMIPFITLIALILLKLPSSVSFLIFLQSTLPPVSAAPIFTERYEGNFRLVNQFLVSSFTVSLISIPSMIYIYQLFIKLPV